LCRDRNKNLSFCAGCRSTICFQETDAPHVSCLASHPDFFRQDKRFFCHSCCKRRGEPFLVLHIGLLSYIADSPIQYNYAPGTGCPNLSDLYFRFDPPVLVISLVHPTYGSGVATHIIRALRGWYVGNMRAVRVLSDSLPTLFPQLMAFSSSTLMFPSAADRPAKIPRLRHRHRHRDFSSSGLWRVFLSFWTPQPPMMVKPCTGRQRVAHGMEIGTLRYARPS